MLVRSQSSHESGIAGGDQQTTSWPKRIAEYFDLVHRPDVVEDDETDLVGEDGCQMLFGRSFLDIMRGIVAQSFAGWPSGPG